MDGRGETVLSPAKANMEMDHPKTARKTNSKVIQTICMYFGFFSLGLSYSIVGPTLLVLQRNTGSSTKGISLLFTARSVVGLLGAILAGYVIDRVNHWLLLSVAIFIGGVMSLLIPHIRSLVMLCGIFAVSGFSLAFYDAGSNMILLKVWRENNGPWMQALHCIFGAGALVGPLLAEPFLKSNLEMEVATTLNATLMQAVASDTYHAVSNQSYMEWNATLPTGANASTVNISSVAISECEDWCEPEVHWAYLIVATTSMIASTFFLYIACCHSDMKFQCRNKLKKNSCHSAETISFEPEDKGFRIQLIVLVFFFYYFYCILETNYGNYLTVYVVKGLGWSEKEGAMVTFGYWSTFTAGRALGILLVRVLSPSLILTGDLVISIISIGFMLFFTYAHDMVLWLCTLSLGLGISTIFATGITWTEQYIQVTGLAGAVFMVAGAGGEMVGPVVIGILFDKFGPVSFIIVMFVAVCVISVIFAAMQWYAVRHGKRRRETSMIIKQDFPDEGSDSSHDAARVGTIY